MKRRTWTTEDEIDYLKIKTPDQILAYLAIMTKRTYWGLINPETVREYALNALQRKTN